ncbi:MAG: hypothetical protein KatS3mg009_2546 [Acidimicrobiia bacterium]|nr:MAG: hypothetical protein KatS3mg009_2546 [Acidimicrobiia bacterium]
MVPVSAPHAARVTLEPGFGRRLARALARRPALVWSGARLLVGAAPPGWWRRPPFVPRPDPGYLRFRVETAYGGGGAVPVRARDVVAYLEWCRAAQAARAARPA